jgi:predicted ATPase
MATVYLAQDLRHNRPVAIKLMNMSLGASVNTNLAGSEAPPAANVHSEGPVQRGQSVHSERFRREIEIAARLSHPHIVPLHDSGIHQDQPYYVMPYVAGESLRQRLHREKSLSVEEAIRLTTEIASALGYAHQQGLIHRDIKPENILLSEGIALVSDFGIARAVTSKEQSALTMAGTTLGTPAYMSPEQFEGADEIDGRSDLYSLGCVIYEMLAGRPPFVGAPYSLAHQHLSTTPRSVTEFRTGIPTHVTSAINKALAKNPSDRFATAAEMVNEISSNSTSAATMVLKSERDTALNNLPKERTRFIGREEELAQGINLLQSNRLLTLTCLGGGGKTRLAIKIAEHLFHNSSQSYPDGVWFVDLSSLTDESRVVDTVAQVLAVRQDADKDLLKSLLANVASKRLLLVLDNCEHLLQSCASLVDELLNVGGELRILATSREALGVRGERVFALRPLSVPSSEAAKDPKGVDSTDAVKLFVDRAQLAQTDFEVNNDNFGDVAEICRRLDGIPLAIELAAARVRVLSVSQIRQKLNDRFRLLTSDGRTALPRHQTLQAAIHWSYEQLSPDEQRLIRSLSVFAGGWTMDLAVKVAGADQLDEFEILDLLTHLIDKSLVIVESEQQGQRRYSMLETVREFTAARLVEAGEIQAVRKQHLQAFLNLAESAYVERVSREQEWADVLQSEIDNLRAALDFARATDSERYLELVGALAWFWQMRSHLREGREYLTAAFSSPGADRTPSEAKKESVANESLANESQTRARARALLGAAQMLSWRGDDPLTAQSWMTDAIKLWRELGDDGEIAFALESLGWAQLRAADDETARTTFEECLRLQQAVGDPFAINRAVVGLAQVLVALSEVEAARPMALEIIRFSETHNDKRSEHFGWHFLADCALIEGNCEESLQLYKRSLAVAHQLGDQVETGFEVQGVAMSLAGLGQLRQGVLLAAAAKAEWDRIGADIHIRFWDELLERYIGSAKKSLSEEELESTINKGHSLSFDEAVSLALEATAKA